MMSNNTQSALEFRNVGFEYAPAAQQVLHRVNLSFAPGELALICGPTGAGKSTLLRMINGLSPHFTGGTASGEILIDGLNVLGRKPRDLAHLVGYVNQRPASGFVAETVQDELAFGMEQLGIAREDMRRRVDEVAALLQIDGLLDRPVAELSGGQQQRVAIGAGVAGGQRILLIDEPTSALDDRAAAKTIALLRELAHDNGLTVLVVEHRIDRLIESVDSITVVRGEGACIQGAVDEFADGFIRDARLMQNPSRRVKAPRKRDHSTAMDPSPALVVKHLTVRHAGSTVDAVHDVSFKLHAGEVVALVGENGAGKSTLLWALLQLRDKHGPATAGEILAAENPVLVPQDASELLFMNTLAAEFAESDSVCGESGQTAALFERLCGRIDTARHPRDLSAGQQLGLVIAIQLARGAKILLLDEPTRGLDYAARREVAAMLDELAASGIAIVIATHDSDLVAAVADRVMNLVDGRLTE